MEAIKTIKYKEHIIEICQDEDPENPREWDNLSVLHCWHKRMKIGDENYYLYNEEDKRRIKQVISKAKRNRDIIYNLYIYQHTGISLSLSNEHYPYNDRWDAGQVGYVIVDRKKALEEYSQKRMSKKLRDKIDKIVEGEIETYNQYFGGDVYGYKVIEDKENEDDDESCWGFYGIESAIEGAKSIVDYIAKLDEVEK